MKKYMMLFAIAMAALVGQSATVDWQYTATATDVDKTVYVLLGDTAVTQWESLEVLQKEAIDYKSVAKSGRSNYWAASSVANDKITKTSANLYYVIVDKAGETFDVTSVADATAMVYDPGAQETSPGNFTGLSPASITSSGNKFGGTDPTPEPTSGLLLVLGVAGLALRRKQA